MSILRCDNDLATFPEAGLLNCYVSALENLPITHNELERPVPRLPTALNDFSRFCDCASVVQLDDVSILGIPLAISRIDDFDCDVLLVTLYLEKLFFDRRQDVHLFLHFRLRRAKR